MRNRSKLILAALTAALALGALVSAATATRLAISNQLFRVTWTGLIFEGGSGSGQVRCPVTMEGTFHSRTIVKNTESLIGFVTSATIREPSCTGGLLTVLQASLPWHIWYDGFSGRLPNIREIHLRMLRAAFKMHSNLNGQECLYTATAASPMKGWINLNTTTGLVESLRPNEEPNAGIPITSGNTGFLQCPTAGFLVGRSDTIGVQGNTATKITVTLVA
jgi:hypothetical protein